MPRRRKHTDTQENKAGNALVDMLSGQREVLALQLRIQGKEFSEIAEACGYAGASGAYKAYKRALAHIPDQIIEEMRKESEMRLRVALRGMWPRVVEGDNWTIDRLINLEERRAKLWGLDVPAGKDVAISGQVLIRRYDADVEAV